jgi:hypothetical protein
MSGGGPWLQQDIRYHQVNCDIDQPPHVGHSKLSDAAGRVIRGSINSWAPQLCPMCGSVPDHDIIRRMASHRGVSAIETHEGQEISSLGTTSGSDAGRLSEKNEGFNEKNGEVVFESSMAEDQLPPYRNHPDAEETEAIHHPANKDDILTHTIHVEDDPTLNAITFRTIFLGKFCFRGIRNCIALCHYLQALPGNR